MNALNTIRLIGAAAAVAAFLGAGPAYAQQTEDAALSRAAVDQATRAAMASGEMMPAGEGRPQGLEAYAGSTKTREQRKAETITARRNGELPSGGLGLYKSNMSQLNATRSVKTRAERKAETMQAIREHKVLKAGEAA